MSFLRSAIPVVMAVGFGIFNAQYVFKPAFEDEARKRDQQALEKGATQNSAASAKAAETQVPAVKP
ncbi:hypothetical protein SUNI508_08707 [Seiridium unicorne]|uniref:Uncharacterized protein n=1 Tax=Seiridium unicorne TaxID=138068 RepID=A0ABR2USJ2_9PEZI